ncbi:OmpA family protein [bacterium]|nr:OmpA family protein [bacterium]
MGIKAKRAKKEEAADNIFWTTMADLMLGLAIIFMTLFVLAMTGFTQSSVNVKKAQVEASKELAEKLKSENIDAQVDNMTGDVKISNLELFEVSSYTLSPNGKKLLDKLAPIYVNTIFSRPELINNIENIVIQGHTDSQSYAGLKTKEEQFTKNMELSLKRANSVAEYMLNTNYDKQYAPKLLKMTTVEGKSFTTPVLTDGKEDYAKSRRVELRLKVKEMNIMNILTTGYGND